MSDELVLVTGGSGFIGAYCILELLQMGYRVRTTVRSLSRENDVRAMLKTGGMDAGDKLSFAAADLTADAGWSEAVKDCKYVLHVASPFPSDTPKHEDELIVPARDGTLRVLKAARDAGVSRVVLTSSFAAIGYGHPLTPEPFDETAWTDINGPDVGAYGKSKTLAERAAWDFIASQNGALELSVVNPVGVLGPVLGHDFSTSIQLIQRLLDGSVPRLPRVSYGLVDVRDVADLHVRAMTNPAAKGERFIASAGDAISAKEVALALKSRLGDKASRVPTQEMPDWLIRALALVNPPLRQIVPNLGRVRHMTNAKAKRVLDWKPRSNEDAIEATAQSLLEHGLVKAK